MYCRWLSAAAAAVLLAVAARPDEPKLDDAVERLTADEEKAARLAVCEGLVTANRGLQVPREVAVPRDLEALFKVKPQATVRLLLKVVDGGRARDSIHAVCCIEALVESPAFAAITAKAMSPDEWDDMIGGANPLTRREHCRRVCVKLIAEKEAAGGKKK